MAVNETGQFLKVQFSPNIFPTEMQRITPKWEDIKHQCPHYCF